MWNLFANELDQFEKTILLFKSTITIVGIGIILIGLVLYFYKPKDETKRSTFAARLTGCVSFCVIGAATIVYAWTWFGK